MSRSVYDTPSDHAKEEGSVVQESGKGSKEPGANSTDVTELKKLEAERNNLVIEASKDQDLESKRRVKDQKLIDERTAALPDGVRRVLKDKFRADFVSIEKIDQNLLI